MSSDEQQYFDDVEFAADSSEVDRHVSEPVQTHTAPGLRLFVSPSGSDQSPGTKASSPLRTITHALRLTRGWRKKKQQKTGGKVAEIQLLAGIHTLNETLILLPQDSHLVLKAAPGEVATVSGGVRV